MQISELWEIFRRIFEKKIFDDFFYGKGVENIWWKISGDKYLVGNIKWKLVGGKYLVEWEGTS